mmetsp:Transcript_36938/g.59761  ORF Transcript_36938/g.59761 Transcript_36938/m.59761 type:complete len:337 (+) Transcript_36938:150-1160(+)|eukprot:CAMPEP_0184664090 /NCGR_PEP_ID=MMETSP0308-20130426/51243_1 /TAXON_ID=38269 /ORGANISM="Gloeochaete witrockiana, Strain SAG 46.84" /LENGTH=336 /DNA_ID=CAMNT_0027107261 /DNA_START=148 /DNA_END=1158 /DNA_ORIENTATION=-
MGGGNSKPRLYSFLDSLAVPACAIHTEPSNAEFCCKIVSANNAFVSLVDIPLLKLKGAPLGDVLKGVHLLENGKRLYLGTSFSLSNVAGKRCEADSAGSHDEPLSVVFSQLLPNEETNKRDLENTPYIAILTSASEDVLERRKLKKALAHSEFKRKALVDTSVDGVVVMDCGGIVKSFNNAASTLFGYSSPADVVGQNVKILMPPEVANVHDQYIRNYLETGQTHVIGVGREVSARKADGTIFEASLSMSESCDVGGQKFFIGILRDRSARKAAEQKLNQHKEWIEKLIADSTDDHLISVGVDGNIYDKSQDLLPPRQPSRIRFDDGSGNTSRSNK